MTKKWSRGRKKSFLDEKRVWKVDRLRDTRKKSSGVLAGPRNGPREIVYRDRKVTFSTSGPFSDHFFDLGDHFSDLWDHFSDPLERPSWPTLWRRLTPPSLYIYIYGGVISDGGWGPEKRSQGEEDLVSRELSEVMWPLAVIRLLIPGFRHAHTLQLLKSVCDTHPRESV